jgi:hypothetical protein
MRYVRIALMSAAAACLLPFATPALAELGHSPGCDRCGGAYYEPYTYNTPYGYYGVERVPAVGQPMSIPPMATALVSPAPAPVSNCHATLYGARHQFYLTMCRL